MRAVAAAFAVVLVAGVAAGAVFERFLSPDNPKDRAITAFVALDREGKASSNDLTDLGVLLLEKGFPKDAERYLAKAVKLDKTNVEARYRLGLVLQREGEFHKAVGQYRKVVKQRPGFAPARFMLALAEERCDRRSAAIKDYAKAYKHAPELADPHFNPLVLDSDLQVEAQLLRYRREAETETIKVEPLDPKRVAEMMAVRPAVAEPAAKPTVAPEAAGVPVSAPAPRSTEPPAPRRTHRPPTPTPPPAR